MIKPIRIVTCAIVIVAISQFSSSLLLAQDVDSLIEKGNVYYGMRQYKQAALYHERALELDPHNCIALNNLGHCYIGLERFPQALNTFRKLEASCKENNRVYGNIGIIYFLSGKRDSAYIFFNMQIDHLPEERLTIMNFLANEYEKQLDTFPIDAIEYSYSLYPKIPLINKELSKRYMKNCRLFRATYHYFKYILYKDRKKVVRRARL